LDTTNNNLKGKRTFFDLNKDNKPHKPLFYIGIDSGTNTGFAVWSTKQKKFVSIETMMIHQAFECVMEYANGFGKENIFVVVEDANKRKWYGSNANAKMQGAGSIKRDGKVWRDFLEDKEIPHEMVHPLRGGTKLDEQTFKNTTGWTERTSNHARDAAMLVINK